MSCKGRERGGRGLKFYSWAENWRVFWTR